MLRDSARRLNANAIVGIKIDIGEISGGGKNMFMVTAIGTPVLLDNVQHNHDRYSDHRLINIKLKAKRLIAGGKHVYELNDEDLSFIAESGLTEFIPYIRKSLELDSANSMDKADRDRFIQKIQYSLLIFNNMEHDLAKDTLYKWLTEDINPAIKYTLSNTIIELELVDYHKARMMLDFDDIISKKHALKILNVDKSVYTENDIKALKILKDGNLLTYFPEAEIVESRGIFGVTRKWRCGCGNINNENDSACVCSRDRMGFMAGSMTPYDFQELINDKISLLDSENIES